MAKRKNKVLLIVLAALGAGYLGAWAGLRGRALLAVTAVAVCAFVAVAAGWLPGKPPWRRR